MSYLKCIYCLGNIKIFHVFHTAVQRVKMQANVYDFNKPERDILIRFLIGLLTWDICDLYSHWCYEISGIYQATSYITFHVIVSSHEIRYLADYFDLFFIILCCVSLTKKKSSARWRCLRMFILWISTSEARL